MNHLASKPFVQDLCKSLRADQGIESLGSALLEAPVCALRNSSSTAPVISRADAKCFFFKGLARCRAEMFAESPANSF
jgi:hypothetical protein